MVSLVLPNLENYLCNVYLVYVAILCTNKLDFVNQPVKFTIRKDQSS